MAEQKFLDKTGLRYLVNKILELIVGKTTEQGGEIFNDYDNNVAAGINSHAEGTNTQTTNDSEHAEGKYNISRSGITIHTVGIGESNENRKNAVEITNAGDMYVVGIGDFDGVNPDNSMTLQDVINTTNDLAYVEDETLKQIGGNNLLVEAGDPHTIIFTDEDIPEDVLVREAPFDSKLYGRKNGNWTEVVAEVPEAPSDNGLYARKNKSWEKFTIPSLDNYIQESPIDDKLYGRKNGNWTEVVAEVPEAPIDDKLYGRKNGNWTEVPGGTGSYVNDETLMRAGDDMVVDGHTVAFTNDNIPVDIVIVDTPFDSKLYGRKNGNWEEITIPETPNIDVQEAPEDSKLYGRKNGNWEAIPSEWFGTQAEYDSLSTKDSNTKYYIYAE